MPTQFPLGSMVPPQVERIGGLFAVTKESATIIVRTITTDATGKNQRLATARSYSGTYLVLSLLSRS